MIFEVDNLADEIMANKKNYKKQYNCNLKFMARNTTKFDSSHLWVHPLKANA